MDGDQTLERSPLQLCGSSASILRPNSRFLSVLHNRTHESASLNKGERRPVTHNCAAMLLQWIQPIKILP